MADIRVVATGLRFPEGPVAMADGSVILGEIAGSAVTRVAPDGGKAAIGSAGGAGMCVSRRTTRASCIVSPIVAMACRACGGGWTGAGAGGLARA